VELCFAGLIGKWKGFGNKFLQHHPLFYNKKQLQIQFYKIVYNLDVFYVFRTSRFHPKGDRLG